MQKALDDAGVEYEVVQHPIRRGKRIKLEQLSGQKVLPAIELESGEADQAESAEMTERIRSGELSPGPSTAY